MEVKDLQQYEIIINKHIEEVNSNAYLLKHKKTGARVVILSNDDDNKVFNIGFRTPVTDDTGVPHIIEHIKKCESALSAGIPDDKLHVCREVLCQMLDNLAASKCNCTDNKKEA